MGLTTRVTRLLGVHANDGGQSVVVSKQPNGKISFELMLVFIEEQQNGKKKIVIE